jgi:hypothetical protein
VLVLMLLLLLLLLLLLSSAFVWCALRGRKHQGVYAMCIQY